MRKYRCKLCNCIWLDNLKEKENSEIKPKALEDLPEDWSCLMCDKDRAEFARTELLAA